MTPQSKLALLLCHFFSIACLLVFCQCCRRNSPIAESHINIIVDDGIVKYNVDGKEYQKPNEIGKYLLSKMLGYNTKGQKTKKADPFFLIIIHAPGDLLFQNLFPVIEMVPTYKIGLTTYQDQKNMAYIDLPFGGTIAGKSIDLEVYQDGFRFRNAEDKYYNVDQLNNMVGTISDQAIVSIKLYIHDDVSLAKIINVINTIGTSNSRLSVDYGGKATAFGK